LQKAGLLAVTERRDKMGHVIGYFFTPTFPPSYVRIQDRASSRSETKTTPQDESLNAGGADRDSSLNAGDADRQDANPLSLSATPSSLSESPSSLSEPSAPHKKKIIEEENQKSKIEDRESVSRAREDAAAPFGVSVRVPEEDSYNPWDVLGAPPPEKEKYTNDFPTRGRAASDDKFANDDELMDAIARQIGRLG
jgi:hypothetical protein